MKFKKFRLRPKLKFVRVDQVILLVTVISAIFSLFNIFYVYLSYSDLPDSIPFFYNMPWGEMQLAPKSTLIYIVAIGLALFLFNTTLSIKSQQKSVVIGRFYSFGSLLINALLNFYILRIVIIAAQTIIEIPFYAKIIAVPLLVAFISTLIIVPFVVKFAEKFKLMDDPFSHKHPAMLITSPTPRAGGLAYFLGILLPALVLLPILSSQKLIGIFIGALICVLMGLWDDRKDVSPYLRLILQVGAVFITVMSGIIITYIPNPFGEVIKFDNLSFVFDFTAGTHRVYYLGVLAAMGWIWWSMNFMSFANGSDGVYAGLVSISSLVIAILMYPSIEADPQIAVFVKFAALSAGAGFGMAVFTWPPQKILWGFGATSAGLIIAALSILGSTKVATTLLVLMIPFFDGLFAIARRISRGKMPFWGDREHLHHIFLDKLGWSKSRVAAFYWITTMILASIGLLTQGKVRALSVATMAAIVIFGISLVNIFGKKGNGKLPFGV